MKIFKKIVSAICTAVLLFLAVPQVLAQNSPTLYFTNITVYTGGGSTYCYLQMKNAENIAAMDYIIIYDSNNLELTDNYKTGFTNQSDVTAEINTSIPGEIHVSLVSTNGISGSGSLNLLCFKAKSDAQVNKYPISVLVNDIYNTTLETVAAERQSGTITIKEGSPTVKKVSFSSYVSKTDLKVGEDFEYKLSAGSLNGLSAGTFDFYYDDAKLKFDEAVLSSAMQNTVYDINEYTDGLVKISFVSQNAITSGKNAVSLKFTAISDGKAEIRFKSSDLYDSDFSGMTGSELSSSVTITEPEQAVDYPDFYITMPDFIPSDKEFTVYATLEGNSGVRAGDFTIEYDQTVLECLGITAQSVSGAYLSKSNDFSEGKIKFSLMSNVDLETDVNLLAIRFKSIENKNSKSAVKLSGKNVSTADFTDVTLEYKDTEIKAVRPEYTVNFYDSDGETILFMQKVMSGNSAIPPETDEIRKCDNTAHLKFVGWDKDYSVISDNTDFTAVYEREAHTEVGIAEVSPGIDTPGYSGGTKCVVCGEILKEQTRIDPTGAQVSATLSSSGMLSVSGAISDSVTTENCVMLGVYAGSKLLDCIDISTKPQNDLSVTLTDMQGANTVKIFRWNSLSGMESICAAIEVKISVTEPVISATFSDVDELSISGIISNDEITKNCVMLGIYEDARLMDCIDISGYNQNKLNITIENMQGADIVKIFRWKSLAEMIPLYGAVEVEVK